MDKREMRAEVEGIIAEKGLEYAIAAMVEGSIGYHTPSQAESIVGAFKAGSDESFCERCMALYQCSLPKMLLSDLRSFGRMSEAGRQQVIETVRKVMSWKSDEQMAFSMAYPTL